VGKKTFACHFGDRAILKLDKGHQELLFEIRPETFSRCKVGVGYWSFVELDDLDEAELAALLLEGWSSIVPKKVSKPYLASLADQPAAGPQR
jgi:hypothetical protein